MNHIVLECRRRTLPLYPNFFKSQRRWMRSAPHQTPNHNHYPYPAHANPTPHQIFHLPHSATPVQIKARYYELVKLYHPDKSGVSSEEQFQAIGHAYDVLRGKRASGSTSTVDSATQATTASRRAMHVRRHQNLYAGGAVDDSWKDKIILAGVAFTVIVLFIQTTTMRQAAIEQARNGGGPVFSPPPRLRTQQDSRLSSDQTEPS